MYLLYMLDLYAQICIKYLFVYADNVGELLDRTENEGFKYTVEQYNYYSTPVCDRQTGSLVMVILESERSGTV